MISLYRIFEYSIKDFLINNLRNLPAQNTQIIFLFDLFRGIRIIGKHLVFKEEEELQRKYTNLIFQNKLVYPCIFFFPPKNNFRYYIRLKPFILLHYNSLDKTFTGRLYFTSQEIKSFRKIRHLNFSSAVIVPLLHYFTAHSFKAHISIAQTGR